MRRLIEYAQHSVDAGGGEQQRECAEDAEQHRIEALRRDRAFHDLLEGAHLGDRQIGIEAGDDRANGGHQRHRIAARVHHELPGKRVAAVREVHGERRRVARPRS